MSAVGGVSRPRGLLFVVWVTALLANPLGGTDECQPRWLGRAWVSVMGVRCHVADDNESQ
jgi:hypothetical protein